MNLELLGAAAFAVAIGFLSPQWMIRQLFSGKAVRFKHTYFFPESVIYIVSLWAELIKGIMVFAVLTHGFHLHWLAVSVLCALSLAACFWSPLKPATLPGAMLTGLLLGVQPSVAVLTAAMGLFAFGILGKPVTACLVALFLFPLLLWSFAPASQYTALGLAIAGLAYVKWWHAIKKEKPLEI